MGAAIETPDLLAAKKVKGRDYSGSVDFPRFKTIPGGSI
jgi:hypothetical protein